MVEFMRSNSLFLRDRGLHLFLRVCKRSFHDLFREKPYMFMLLEWSSIFVFTDNVFCASGSHVQDTGVLKLQVVTQVYTVLRHS
jgi:hypothetical protein